MLIGMFVHWGTPHVICLPPLREHEQGSLLLGLDGKRNSIHARIVDYEADSAFKCD
jgi:hypothetical protein